MSDGDIVMFLDDRYAQWRGEARGLVGDYYRGADAKDDLETIATETAIVERCWKALDPDNHPPTKGADGRHISDPIARYLARDVLRLLAAQFAKHPDFDPAWRMDP